MKILSLSRSITLVALYFTSSSANECTVTNKNDKNVSDEWVHIDDHGSLVVKCNTGCGCDGYTVSGGCDQVECSSFACYSINISDTTTVKCSGMDACLGASISGAYTVCYL